MRETLLVVIMLAMLALYGMVTVLQTHVDFLHAWNVVKKERVDRLARGICIEECKK